jgi:hypothetical protein
MTAAAVYEMNLAERAPDDGQSSLTRLVSATYGREPQSNMLRLTPMHLRQVFGSFADSAFSRAAWISAMPAIGWIAAAIPSD